ncbi:uncharacterized protein LOC119402283 isoform X2 [Rhipicephalus sanguineus]|nr:uncharacterized protein LOC119402283 isoform X2 [Rhipicephalus sanguineus]
MTLDKQDTTIVVTCIRHRKIDVTENQYNFTVYESLNDTEVAGNRTGRFIYPGNDTNKPPISTTVHRDSDEPDYMVTLVYTDPDSHDCNVYSISYMEDDLADDFPTCEMHIKNSSVHDGPTTSCSNYYESKCNGTKYQPYSQQCSIKGRAVNVYS